MNPATSLVPRFGIAAAILRKVTERLAGEVVQPSATAPDWSETEWVFATAAAAMQGISVLLGHRLRWSGPDFWQSFLADQIKQSALCHEKVGHLGGRLDAALRNNDCAAVALKGYALRVLKIYRPGERPMGDIDLLVRSADASAVQSAMQSLDYVLAHSKQRHDTYEPAERSTVSRLGEHADNPLKVEVHFRIAEQLPFSGVDVTDCLAPRTVHAGLNPYRSTSFLLLHTALHAAGNMRAHAARQIQFNDIAELARRMESPDWDEFLRAPDNSKGRWWVYPPLAVTNRYNPDAVPRDVLSAARAACPVALRRWVECRSLTDVSWSNLRIHAFPGLAWSRTPAEAVRYMRSRALPSHTAMTELKLGLKTQSPDFVVPWYRISHARRIWRWLVSRPPRVQTMASLTAALNYANDRSRSE